VKRRKGGYRAAPGCQDGEGAALRFSGGDLSPTRGGSFTRPLKEAGDDGFDVIVGAPRLERLFKGLCKRASDACFGARTKTAATEASLPSTPTLTAFAIVALTGLIAIALNLVLRGRSIRRAPRPVSTALAVAGGSTAIVAPPPNHDPRRARPTCRLPRTTRAQPAEKRK
jgi:hypothetical protein